MTVLAFAMPAMAAVTISATDEGNGLVRIDYSTDANVSAFALKVSFDSGATVNDVNNYHVGESVAGDKGYGIFLDKVNGIKINSLGQVTDDGIPIADPCAPGAAGTGLGTSAVILEMGALYEEGNQPDLSGTLCKVQYDSTSVCTMTIAGDSTRGNVVLEDATAATTNLPVVLAGLPATEAPDECMPSNHMTPDYSAMGGLGAYSDYSDWVAVDKPGCWCKDNDPNANPRQCWGDADKAYGGGTKLKYWVSVNDLSTLLAAWQKNYANIQGQTFNGTPLICADFDHRYQGGTKLKYRVSTYDLSILLYNWQINDGPDPTCP